MRSITHPLKKIYLKVTTYHHFWRDPKMMSLPDFYLELGVHNICKIIERLMRLRWKVYNKEEVKNLFNKFHRMKRRN
jgi:hypothetical protein